MQQASLISLHKNDYYFIIMHSENEEMIQSNDSVLLKLNLLNDQMESQVNISQQLLRQYVGLYVQKHSLSEDFFGALCEHTIITKLFAATKHIPSVIILEIFNLLLANTSQQNNLIFIFSQSCLHDFLFDRFDPFTESTEAVQYYVQLLKTIVLKISSHGHNSLIKLFCNNRHPSFPLLSLALTLAAAYTHEELVRVTACQVVLQIIALINEKKVGRGYLTDLPMAVFFHEITARMREECGEEGHLKYLIDLLYALRDNPTARSLLFSAFTNNVLLPLLPTLPSLLLLLLKMDQLMEQHGKFPQQQFAIIRRVFLNILCSFYFDKFTNSTYMTALKLLDYTKTPQPNLLKYYQKRGEKIGAFLLQFDGKEESDEEKLLLFGGWVNFNNCSEQIQKIKEGKIYKSRGFFGFFSRVDPLEEYIKKALTCIGLDYDALRFPLFKLSTTINMKTAVFLIEEALTLRQERGEEIERNKLQAHICDFKGKFQLSQQLSIEILHMAKKLQKYSIGMQGELQGKCPPKVILQYHFLLRLRGYLLNTLGDYLLIIDNQLSLSAISAVREAIISLGILPLLDKKTMQKIVWKLEQVHQEINDLTFANDFKKLIGYVIYNKQRQFLKLFHQNKYTSIIPNSLVQVKTFKYQFLRAIIDPQLESISGFVSREWEQNMSKQEVALLSFSFVYKQIGSITIKSNYFSTILSLKAGGEENGEVVVVVREDEPRVNVKNGWRLQFAELQEGIEVRDKEQSNEVRNCIERVRLWNEEQVTKLIVQYFQGTYNQIRDSMLKRGK